MNRTRIREIRQLIADQAIEERGEGQSFEMRRLMMALDEAVGRDTT